LKSQNISSLETKKERCVIVGVSLPGQSKEEINEYLEELVLLVHSANADVIKIFKQNLNKINSKFFVGKGKVEEIAEFVKKNNIDTVIFDDELSPSQIRNLERIIDCKIIDRTNLILDIFADHAKTAIAKAQVELAQYEYLLPRLTRMWTHLSKQRGGIGMRGPGEEEIETDRRIIRNKINKLKKQLDEIDTQKQTQRKHRESIVRATLIGYTNVGKSTIMNILSKSNIMVKDKLFSTLDTTTRKVMIKDLSFLLSDTVGFIRKLPTFLIESFKSTLAEVNEADILLHVVDLSSPLYEKQMQVVYQILSEINAVDKTIITIFNKIDLFEEKMLALNPHFDFQSYIDHYKNSYSNNLSVFISATKNIGIDELKDLLYDEISKVHEKGVPGNKPFYL
jgi:GTP-binding protein HflX